MNDQIPLHAIAAAVEQGMPAEAERLSREYLVHAPDDENLHFLLAFSLQQQERHADAVDSYGWLTARVPQSPAHWTNYSTALRLAGRLAEAEAAAHQAIRLAPDDATHYIALGLAQLQNGRPTAARDALMKAVELDPRSPIAHIHAASALVALHDGQSWSLPASWRSWLPLDPAEQLLLAHLLMTNGDADDAYEVLIELTQRAPMHLPARLQLAALYERKNELDLAETVLADSAARFVQMDRQAQLEWAHQRAILATRRGRLADARAILEEAGPRTVQDYAHHFTLADIRDKLGDTAAAMESLAAAHVLQIQAMTPLAPARFVPDAPLLPNAVGRLSREGHRHWPALLAPGLAHSPIFIVGFPRSGTTLLEQMLDAHPALQSMDERPFFTVLGNELVDLGVRMPEEIGRLNQRDCDELRRRYHGLVAEKIHRAEGARLVDKNPLNMLWVPLIKRLFPESKFILALRHPCDVVLSNYLQNYRSSVLASACSTLERTARSYVAAMEAWLYHVDLLQPEILVSRYEELVADPAVHTRRIADFLGLDDAGPMLRHDQHARDKGFIATPSYTEVIRPISARRIDRWRRYPREFDPVLPILAPMLTRWGYAG